MRVALLKHDLFWRGGLYRDAREILAAAATIDAQLRSPEELWTPTLDAIASSPWERWKLKNQKYRRHNHKPFVAPYHDDLVRAICEDEDPLPAFRALLQDKIVPQLRARGLSVEEAKMLLAATAWQELVDEIVKLPPASLEFFHWLSDHKPSALPAFAARPDLTPEIQHKLWRFAVHGCTNDRIRISPAAVMAGLQSQGAIPPDGFEQLMELCKRSNADVPPERLVQAILTLFWATQPGDQDIENLFNEILSSVQNTWTTYHLIVRYSWSDHQHQFQRDRFRAAIRAFAKLQPRMLETLKPYQTRELEAEDWLPALQATEESVAGFVANFLADTPSALEHPAARAFIYQYGWGPTLLEMFREITIPPEERRAAARAILRERPLDFLEIFQRHPELKDALEIADLDIVLQSKRQEVREDAIRLLGELNTRGTEATPEPTTTDLPRRPTRRR